MRTLWKVSETHEDSEVSLCSSLAVPRCAPPALGVGALRKSSSAPAR